MIKPIRLRLALILLLLILVFSFGLFLGRSLPRSRIWSAPAGQGPGSFYTTNVTRKVARVIDGDTIVIDTGEHVRYLGMNSPEMGQPFSQEAKDLNAKLVLNKEVRLEFDAVKKDKYGRLLAYLWIDQILINERLLEEGLAKTLFFNNEPPLKYETRLRSAETLAQKKSLGLWQKTGSTRPQLFYNHSVVRSHT